jgi:hypothetical protein
MNIERRDFLKGCATASVLLVPGIAGAAGTLLDGQVSIQGASPPIEKSIKAGFGGGFSVRSHRVSNGFTVAEIQHFGNRYTVASADLIDWKIVGSA